MEKLKMEKLLIKAELGIPTKLFKKDSKGKIRSLEIESFENTVQQTSGLVGGTLTTNVSVCVAKNVGRSNETTAEEQAIVQAMSKFEKKLKEGYFTNRIEAENSIVYLPMLAKVFSKEEKKIIYPCFAQPKLDGMRGLNSNKGWLMSRSGNPITTLDHVQFVFPSPEHIILDGELYAHGFNFQENMRMIKKYRPGVTEMVKHHVYDLISDEPFAIRQALLYRYVGSNPNFHIVETIIIANKEELMLYHAKNIEGGYEGTIVRWGDDGYKLNGRSSNLLKLKDFDDLSLPLKGVIPSEKRPDHGRPYFNWVGATGHPAGENILGAGIALSHEEAEDLLINAKKYIGKTCELRFFGKSDKGVPRHPTMYGFRLDK